MTLIGFRKQWRKLWENPIFCKHPNRITVWMWILDHVAWEEGKNVYFGNKTIELKRGQITCGLHQIASETGVNAKTVHRILNLLKNEKQIEKETDMQCSLITVINWDLYQLNEKGNEEGVRNDRETSEKRVRTNKERKKDKKIKNTYVCRTETKALYESVRELCEKYGIQFSLNIKSLDVLVERYVGKIHMKVEAQHCISWLVDKNLRAISTQRLGNWFKNAQKIQKRDQLRQLERKEAEINPAMAARRKELKSHAEGFDEEQSIQDFISSQSSQ